ncbi:MAG: ABC transporter permease subunit [Actinomycetota bacterium]
MGDDVAFVARNLLDLLIGLPAQRPGGLLLSILLSAASLSVGFGLAVIVASLRDAPWAPVRAVGAAFVTVFRGVPLIMLLLIVHQFAAGGLAGIDGSTLRSAFVTLVLYAGAYQADIITSGLRAVPASLVEDARVLGASPLRAFLTVRLPYGLRVMGPALAGQAITLFKDSSVVVVLGVAELTTTARIVLGNDVANAPYWVATYLAVGALYLFTASGLSTLFARLTDTERHTGLVGH